MRLRTFVAGSVVVLLAGIGVDAGPMSRAAGEELGQAGPVHVTATADIDGKHYGYTGPGECHYAADGSIHDAPAAMWHAAFRPVKNPWSSANLSIWQLKQDGTLQVTFASQVGSLSYDIATVKAGPLRGSATGSTERRGAGGTIAIDGRIAEARSVRVRITCSRFDAPEDNG